MGKLINLADFRRRNGMSQSELGQLIGTSASFISLVETGNSKMPLDKMKKIWELAPVKGWKIQGLVPAYDRLVKLDDTYMDAGVLSQNDIARFHTGFDQIVSEGIMEMIKYGQRGIDETLAENIMQLTSWPLHVSKKWLVDGEGLMCPPECNLSDLDSDDNQASLYHILQGLVRRLDDVEKQLGEIKSLLVQKM